MFWLLWLLYLTPHNLWFIFSALYSRLIDLKWVGICMLRNGCVFPNRGDSAQILIAFLCNEIEWLNVCSITLSPSLSFCLLFPFPLMQCNEYWWAMAAGTLNLADLFEVEGQHGIAMMTPLVSSLKLWGQQRSSAKTKRQKNNTILSFVRRWFSSCSWFKALEGTRLWQAPSSILRFLKVIHQGKSRRSTIHTTCLDNQMAPDHMHCLPYIPIPFTEAQGSNLSHTARVKDRRDASLS